MRNIYDKTRSFIKNTKTKVKQFFQNSQNPNQPSISTDEELKEATVQALKTYEKYEKFKNSSVNKYGVEKKTTKSNQEALTVFTDNGPVTAVPGIEIFAFNTNDYSSTWQYEGIFDDGLYYNVEIKKCSDIYYDDNHKPARVIVNGFSVNPETKEVKFISEQKQGTYHHISAQFSIFAHKYSDTRNYNNIKEK